MKSDLPSLLFEYAAEKIVTVGDERVARGHSPANPSILTRIRPARTVFIEGGCFHVERSRQISEIWFGHGADSALARLSCLHRRAGQQELLRHHQRTER